MKPIFDLQLKGGTQVNAEGDITLVAGHDLLIEAAKDTRSHDSRTTGGKFGIDIQGGGFTVGGNGGYEEGNGDTYTYAGIRAGGDLTTVSGNDTVIRGGNLYGENVYMEVGGDLRLETLQNYNKFESKNASASVTFSMAGVTGASASYGQTDAKRRWSDNVSNITGKDRVAINVGGNTDLLGSLINSESGNLALNTETLTFRDLNDSDKLFSINVSISTNGGGGIMGGIGFSLTDDDKRGITRATVGEGTINVRSDADGHSLDGLNRDVTQVQEVTKDDHFGMHMTVPIIDPDQMVEEGKVVIPTAYAMYSTGWNALTSIITQPAVMLERPILDAGKLDYSAEYVGVSVERSIAQYDNAYKIGEVAYLYKPEWLPALFGYQLPLIGNFISSPVGEMNNLDARVAISSGIALRARDKEGNIKYDDKGNPIYARDEEMAAGLGLDKNTSKLLTYDHGSDTEIATMLLFGNTAPMLEAAGQMLFDNSKSPPYEPNSTIVLIAHSGGVERITGASKYLGFYDIGVVNAQMSQGPSWSVTPNIQSADYYYTILRGDFTSNLSMITLPVNDLGNSVAGNNNTYTIKISSDGWLTDKHIEPGRESEFDGAIKQNIQRIMNDIWKEQGIAPQLDPQYNLYLNKK